MFDDLPALSGPYSFFAIIFFSALDEEPSPLSHDTPSPHR
jgi:hypothetical protein